MTQGALAAHYAAALADAVFAPNAGLRAEDAVAQLRAVDELIGSSAQLQHALISPAVNKSRKSAVVARLAEEMGLNRKLRNFLLVLVSHRRIKELSAIRRSFEVVVDERLGWIPAEIMSAKELSADERKEIEQALGTQLGKFIRARYRVDPSLIGGVRAQVASREYDATIRGRLESMRQRLVTA